jgi:hypothetical protein
MIETPFEAEKGMPADPIRTWAHGRESPWIPSSLFDLLDIIIGALPPRRKRYCWIQLEDEGPPGAGWDGAVFFERARAGGGVGGWLRKWVEWVRRIGVISLLKKQLMRIDGFVS